MTKPITTPDDTSSGEALARIIQDAGKPRHLRRYLWLLVIIGLLVGGWFFYGRATQTSSNEPNFAREELRRGDLSLNITVTGNLEPTNEVTVGSELSGIVLEVNVETNDHVTLGQPLAKLDTSKLEAQIESGRASLSSSKAKVAQAKATLKESEAALARWQHLEKISSGKAVSQADLDAAIATSDRSQADVLSAEASVGEAEAQLRIHERDLEKAVIQSPIDGIVLTRDIEPGQTVAASFTAPELFVIAEKLEHMKLIVTVAEADIGHVKTGQAATFTVDAWPDRVYSAIVTKVAFGSSLTDNVVTYEAELQVSNDDLTLRPGMTATADIKSSEAKNEFLVSNEALRFDPVAAEREAAMASPQKQTFMQSLMPRSSRRIPPSRSKDSTESPVAKAGNHRIWVLRDGKPYPVSVNLGIGGERQTVVSGEELSEGLPVILRAQPAPTTR